MTFSVGDKVTNDSYGDGVIAFGPYLVPSGNEAYLVVDRSGAHRGVYGEYLAARPAYAVGDTVRYDGCDVAVTYGPFKTSEYATADSYMIRFDGGAEMGVTASSLSPLPAGPAVGDMVRVTGESLYEDLPIGTVGELKRVDDSDDEFPYWVCSSTLEDCDWVRSVEKL